jgi:hypothetical protein
MRLKAIHCKSCNEVLYSRAQHDFRECSCGYVNVNGGQHYFKYGHAPGAEFSVTEIDVDVSLSDLYDDWNDMADNYGVVQN